jgi:hypothetical protein
LELLLRWPGGSSRRLAAGAGSKGDSVSIRGEAREAQKGDLMAEKTAQQRLNERETRLKKQLEDIATRKQIAALKDKLKKK